MPFPELSPTPLRPVGRAWAGGLSFQREIAMKIIHTADWHLGNTFHGHDRHDEQAYFLDRLVDLLIEEQPDALLVAGDVFDTSNPSAAAERLFFDFLSRATAEVGGLQIVVTAGNHDSAARLEAPATMLSTHRVFVRGTVRRTADGEVDYGRHLIPLRLRNADRVAALCLAVPFLRACDYPAGLTPSEGVAHFFRGLRQAASAHRNVGVPLVTVAHFYAAGADVCADEHSERLVVGGQECVDVERLPRGFSYVALGHIHKGQAVAGRSDVRYAGSALPMSFSERGYRHGVVRVEIDEAGHAVATPVELPPLRPLLSLPRQGAATADEMFRAVSRLPRIGPDDDGATWPYLEMRIVETQPDPMLVTRLLGALSDRAVHFCRVVRSVPTVSEPDAPAIRTTDELAAMQPLDMARLLFAERYHNPMPSELEKLFRVAEADCHESE